MPTVLVAFERSGVVRRAFQKLGVDAWSCDLEPADDGEVRFHVQTDVFRLDWSFYDLVIAHPPCTHICCSGARYFAAKRADGRQQEGIETFLRCFKMGARRLCVENPVGIMSTLFRKPDQVIQPHWFGVPESKATCLWLEGLPKLGWTNVLEPAQRYCRACKKMYDSQYREGVRCPQCGSLGPARWNNQTPSGSNKLGPSKDRAAIRSRTYEGVAAAMAAQWSPLLKGNR